MVEVVKIEAVTRERSGKGAARATRREGRVPGVVYGGGTAPALIKLDPRLVMKELNRLGWRSRLFDVAVGDTVERSLMRDVQFHPVTDRPEHVDFQRLAPGQEIRVGVEVEFINQLDSPGLKKGGVLNVVRHEVEIYAAPDVIPDKLTIDLTGLEIGASVHISAVKLGAGVRPVISDRDFTICTIAAPSGSAEAAAEAAAAAAAAPVTAKAPVKAAAPAKGGAAPAKGAAPAAKAPTKK